MRWMLWRPPCVRQRVLINVTYNSEEALEGVLWSYRGGWITLRDVSAVVAGQPPTKMKGDVVVHVRNVAYLQVLSQVPAR
jgi:hypothetical protein